MHFFCIPLFFSGSRDNCHRSLVCYRRLYDQVHLHCNCRSAVLAFVFVFVFVIVFLLIRSIYTAIAALLCYKEREPPVGKLLDFLSDGDNRLHWKFQFGMFANHLSVDSQSSSFSKVHFSSGLQQTVRRSAPLLCSQDWDQ